MWADFLKIVEPILYLAAGVGLFMAGIVMFSACLEKNASKGVRALFKKIGNRPAAGVGVGAGVTAIIQSSSATTVMVIGLVNAGIITLFQATSIIMGANIGTTVTGLLLSIQGVKFFKFEYLFMAMAFVGALIKLITKKEKAVKIADLLLSFGIMFAGMEVMKLSLSNSAEMTQLFKGLFEAVSFPLLLVLLGVIFTALIQSSSAATGIFIVMIGQGVLQFDSALYLVLGANIGTCITAFIASIAANTNAKRAALVHILFNVIGSVLFISIMWPLGGLIVPVYQSAITDPVWQLSIFHVIFNVLTTLIMVWFIKPLNRLTCFLIKDKEGEIEMLKPAYIDELLLATPSIAIEQTKKEIVAMAGLAKDGLGVAFDALITHDLSDKEKLTKIETKVNYLNQALARYLVQLSMRSISYTDEKLIGGFHHVINDVERIGDYAVGMLENAEDMKETGSVFSEVAIEELKTMYGKVLELFDLSVEVFTERKTAKLKEAVKLEAEIREMKGTLANAHITRLNAGQCTIEGGESFYTVIGDLERVSDHLNNIACTIRSYTGSQREALRKINAEKQSN